MRVRTALSPILRFIGAMVVALIGATFFFAIIGVFGLAAAIAALALFLLAALLTFRRPQVEVAQR